MKRILGFYFLLFFSMTYFVGAVDVNAPIALPGMFILKPSSPTAATAPGAPITKNPLKRRP
jgi:hypothetical protein